MHHRIVFMGTPEFAIPILKKLIDEYTGGQLVAVVTQPDQPSGRGRRLASPPVKLLAERYALPVLQPKSLRTPEVLAELRVLQPDLIVVAAFGQIVPPAILELPRFGCLNVHASLLPRWRGAAPVAAAILAGDEVTGVTLMKMDAGLDTGPILTQRDLTVTSDDTSQSLGERLARLGAELLSDTLPDWLAGKIQPQPQDEALATYAPKIDKEQGRIDWTQPADKVVRKVRAFYPWPGAFTYWRDEPLKVLRATADMAYRSAEESRLLPGSVGDWSGGPAVVAGEGLVHLYEVQAAGKRPMAADAFARGARDFVGARLA
jgi:methionyl-tRNA formyltransferase